MSIEVGPPWGSKPNTMLIPFAGFYESLWDAAIENEVSSAAELLLEELKQEDRRFHDASFGDILHEVQDEVRYGEAKKAIAKEYASRFSDWLERELELDGNGNNIRFSRLDSPHEYNFRTDWVFVDIHPYACQRLWSKADEDVLSATIIKHHTPRMGFFSHYSAIPDDWENRDHTSWDHNEMFTKVAQKASSFRARMNAQRYLFVQ